MEAEAEAPDGPSLRLAERPYFDSVLTGIKVFKHVGRGRPHLVQIWLDLDDPKLPLFRWGALGPRRNDAKRALPLTLIHSVKAGFTTRKLERHGSKQMGDLYASFKRSDSSWTLDLQFNSKADRDWFYNNTNEMFQAIAQCFQEKVPGSQLVAQVRARMDPGSHGSRRRL